MSTTIKPVNNGLFAWGYNKLAQIAEYTVRSTMAVFHVAQQKMYKLRTGKETFEECPEFQTHRTLTQDVEEASKGVARPVTTEAYLDIRERTFGVCPKTKRVHTVDDPKLIEELLHAKRDDLLLDSGFKEVSAPLVQTDTMLLCPYAEHRRLRSPLEKTFSKRSAQKEAVMHSMAQTATALILQQVNEASETIITKFVFASIIQQVMGIDLSPEAHKELWQALSESGNSDTCLQGRQKLETIIARILKEHHYGVGGGMDALAEAKFLSEAEKISTTILMFAAGMHTTITFLKGFLEVLRSSRYSERLYAEWNAFTEGQVFQSTEEMVSYVTQFVQKSDLLNSCYLETLRLYPVFPIIKRIAKKDFMLGNTRIYAGDEVHLNVMAAQRDLGVWSEPNIFKPERFKDSLESGQKPTLLSFGLGSQSCIGRHYVESEAKIMGALFCILLQHPERSDPPKLTANNYGYDSLNLFLSSRTPISSTNFSLRDEWRTV